MSNSQIKEYLWKEKENLEKQLKAYGSEDPYLGPDRDPARNLDDAPTESEEHDRIGATTRDLRSRLGEVDKALGKIERGKYGSCELCSKKISEERLLALPTARYCLDCQSKGRV